MTTAKHARKHKHKEARAAAKAIARDGDGADRLAEAAKKREASEAAQRKEPCK